MSNVPFRHPLATHAAGTVLGQRRNGSPIYAIAGGSGEGEGGSGGTPPGAPPAGNPATPPGTPPAQPPAAPPADPWASFQWDGKVESLPEPVAKVIRDARAEAGKERTTAKENAAKEAREALLKELGLVKADETPDPAKLAAEIGDKDTRIGSLEGSVRSLTVELAAYKAAPKHEANAAALLDSRAFMESVAGLDPTAADFATKLDDAIKDAVDTNQQLRMVPGVPRRGGGDFPGGPGTTGRPTSLGQAVAAALGG
ncbi:hypothetical protein F3K39_28270 [Streptomyces sp. LBUM 1479]|uniref:hypothetical protein n=1 Tax=Streptomyces scabiei TaxID=1930 RepID=UPI001B33232B|nr:hypothetical protein [Streptomyces scabiei]MBP5931833.1 hypothetical protein [Streptomyces sp. LBUM 1479]MDX3028273.1 hypothetical protein [Streptomyces scabiei]